MNGNVLVLAGDNNAAGHFLICLLNQPDWLERGYISPSIHEDILIPVLQASWKKAEECLIFNYFMGINGILAIVKEYFYPSGIAGAIQMDENEVLKIKSIDLKDTKPAYWVTDYNDVANKRRVGSLHKTFLHAQEDYKLSPVVILANSNAFLSSIIFTRIKTVIILAHPLEDHINKLLEFREIIDRAQLREMVNSLNSRDFLSWDVQSEVFHVASFQDYANM